MSRYRHVVGPNFFIWIAIGLVLVSAIPSFYGYYWITALGWVVALGLGIFNKIKVIRRRGSLLKHPVRISLLPLVGVLIGVAAWQGMVGDYIFASGLVAGAAGVFVVQMIRVRRWRRRDQAVGR